MEHLALYRKYRPSNFDEVIGQQHITKTLSNQIAAGQLSHAYLFCGTRGTGKTSVAKIFAKAVSCENNQTGNPCNICSSCVSLSNPANVDVMEIDAASNNGVDNIRDLKDNIKYPPILSKYKVYIVDEVHMLSESAFNALLKTLEEPPSYVIFILATTEPHKLPSTILSRCMRFDFRLVSTKDLQSILTNIFKQEQISCEREALALLASLGEGSVRDTLSIADKCSAFSNKNITYSSVLEATGSIGKSQLINLAKNILQKEKQLLLTEIAAFSEHGKNIAQLNKELTSFFRDLTIVNTCDNFSEILFYPADILEQLKKLSDQTTFSTLLSVLNSLSGLENEFRYSQNQRELFEITVLSLMSEMESSTPKKTVEKSLSTSSPALVISNKQIFEKETLSKNSDKNIISINEFPSTAQKNNVASSNVFKALNDPDIIFSNVLNKTRENKNFKLYALLDKVTSYNLEDSTFILNLDDASSHSLLVEEKTFSELSSYFKKNGGVDVLLHLTKEENNDEQILLSHFKDILIEE